MWDLTRLRFTCNSRKLFKTHFWGPFSFDEKTADGKDYLNMLQLWFLPKLPNNERCIFQQDGAPPHWALATRAFLKDELPGRWIGCCSARDQCLMPCHEGLCKNSVYVLPLPQSIEELKDRISAAIKTISAELLDRVHSCLRKRLFLLVKTGGRHI